MLATPSILSAGWKNFKSAWPLLFAAFFFLAIAMVPLQLPIQVLNYSGMFQPASMPSVGTIIALAVCGILAQQFIMVPCFASVAMAGASAARLEPTRLKSILSAFSSVQRYGAVVGAGLIASLVLLPLTLLTLVPIVIAVAYGPGFTVDWWVWSQHINTLVVGYVATLVLGVCLLPLAIRLWVAPLRAADSDLPPVGALDALRMGWAATRGRGFQLMGLAVFTCILVCLSALACGIGIFFIGYPYGIAVVGVAYNDLFPGPTKELDVVVVGARPPMVDG